MPVTIIYAAILALFYVCLAVRIIRLRKHVKVSIGDGGDEQLNRAIRVHANFSEYVPLSLLLLYFLETQGGNAIVVQLLATLLLLSRMVHAYGVSQINENFKFRVFGMVTTIVVIVSTAMYLLLIAAGIAG